MEKPSPCSFERPLPPHLEPSRERSHRTHEIAIGQGVAGNLKGLQNRDSTAQQGSEGTGDPGNIGLTDNVL